MLCLLLYSIGCALVPSKRNFFRGYLCSFGIAVYGVEASPEYGNVPAIHGVAMMGPCKYGPDHPFALVNPQAPKGGTLRLSSVGPSFTTLNPFCPGQECAPLIECTFDTLMARSPDEPFAMYGLLAQSIQMPKDRSWLIIHLNPLAKFHSGNPVKAEDVVFTYNTLRTDGPPGVKNLAKKVKKVTILDDRTLRFDFLAQKDGTYDQEVPLVLLNYRIFSKSSLKGKNFDKIGLVPLETSGPYRIQSMDPGKSIVYVRDTLYWGRHLAINQGRYNVDRLSVEMFYNELPAFEAFLRGLVDVWEEKDAKRWKKGYHVPAIERGDIRRLALVHRHPVGMWGFALNQNHPALRELEIRKAIALAFLPEELKLQMDPDAVLTSSFFQNTEFEAPSRPSKEEETMLASLPYPRSSWDMPPSSLKKRERILLALQLAAKAGWKLQDHFLMKDRHPLALRIVTRDREETKIAQVLLRCLTRIGMQGHIQQMDPTQYAKAVHDRTYDVILYRWGHSLSPGIEQKLYWHSRSTNQVGSRNYSGIQDPNVDFLCDQITQSETRSDLVNRLRALDRVLRAGYYVLPLFHRSKDYWAFWKHVKTPPFIDQSPYWPSLHSFWIEES